MLNHLTYSQILNGSHKDLHHSKSYEVYSTVINLMQLYMYWIFHCVLASSPGTTLLLWEKPKEAGLHFKHQTACRDIIQVDDGHSAWLDEDIIWCKTDPVCLSPAPPEQWTARHSARQQLPSPVAGTGTEWYTAGTKGYTNCPLKYTFLTIP